MFLRWLQVVVEILEVVVDGYRFLWVVLGGFRSFHVLVLTAPDNKLFFTFNFHTRTKTATSAFTEMHYVIQSQQKHFPVPSRGILRR